MPITYAATQYDTEQAALEESVYEFCTATGKIDAAEALAGFEDRDLLIYEATKDWADGGAYWGVMDGDEIVKFDAAEINRAFDVVATRLREEIAEAESVRRSSSAEAES